MNGKRAVLVGLFGASLLLVLVGPAAAQGGTSTNSDLVWGLNNQLIYIAVPITVLVEGILIYTVWRFSKSQRAQPTQENRRLEITWTLATALILLFVGVATYQVLGEPYVSPGAATDGDLDNPRHAEEIEVTALQFAWQFEYPDVSFEGASGEDLTLENVDVSGGTVATATAENVTVEDAEIRGEEIAGGTLEVGTIEGVEAAEGEQVTVENVTVEGANVTDLAVENATVESTGTIHMPADRDVRLNVRSRDVVHAFHAPQLGLKSDAFPGRNNTIYTNVNEPGEYQLYCSEYCGVSHSNMLGEVHVHSEEEYDQWLQEQWLSDR